MILLSYISAQKSISLAKIYRNGIIESKIIWFIRAFYTYSKVVSRNHVPFFIPQIERYSPRQFLIFANMLYIH